MGPHIDIFKKTGKAFSREGQNEKQELAINSSGTRGYPSLLRK